MPAAKVTGPFVEMLRAMALRLPEATESTSCNKIAFRARNKNFLFVGSDGVTTNTMLKLSSSLPEAAKLAKKHQVNLGSSGWVKAVFSETDPLPTDVLQRWVDESFRLLAPKALVADLPISGKKPRSAAKKSATKKKTPTKRAVASTSKRKSKTRTKKKATRTKPSK